MVLTICFIVQIVIYVSLITRFSAEGSYSIHVYRNDELFDAGASRNALLKLVTRDIDNYKFADLSYCSYTDDTKRYYFVDSDLESIFCSQAVVNAFWKILKISFGLKYTTSRVHDQTSQADKNYMKEMFAKVVPDNITREEILEIIKLLSFSGVLGEDIKFLLDFCMEYDIFKLVNKDKVVEWIIDKAYETALQFEKFEPNYEAWENYSTPDKVATLKAKMKKAEKYEILFVSGAKLMLSCLDYIRKRIENALSCGNSLEIREALYLFCKIVASTSWAQIQLVRLDETGKKLRKLMFQMFNVLEINKCMLGDGQAVQDPYLNAINLIRADKSMYYNSRWFNGSHTWIHIGSKTSDIFETYGKNFVECFWKALGNIFRGLDSVPWIHITISKKKDTKQLGIFKSKKIEFKKFDYWVIFKGYLNVRSSGLSFISTENRQLIFEDNKLTFQDEALLPYQEFACTVTFEYFSGDSLLSVVKGLEYVLPAGRYMRKYIFLDKDPQFILRALGESAYTRPDHILIHFSKPRGKPVSQYKSNYINKTNQALHAVAKGLKIYFGNSSNVRRISLSVTCEIFLEVIFELAAMNKNCETHVQCPCHSRKLCVVQTQCDVRIKRGERVIFGFYDD